MVVAQQTKEVLDQTTREVVQSWPELKRRPAQTIVLEPNLVVVQQMTPAQEQMKGLAPRMPGLVQS